jgi:hypothetical protein
VQDALPASDWPIYVTAGALTLLGVVDLPVAVGGTVLYLVGRHWPLPRDQRTPAQRARSDA